MMNSSTRILVGLLLLAGLFLPAAEAPLTFTDSNPQRYTFTTRASELDPRARPHPESDFVFEKDGKPAGVPVATVAIGNGRNAGLLAVKILAASDSALRRPLLQFMARQARASRAKNRSLTA